MDSSFFCPADTLTLATNKSSSFAEIEEISIHHAKTCLTMQQMHGADFLFLESETLPTTTQLPAIDGLLTTNTDLLLTVRTADCLPILLYHPSGIVGALHAGRKSTQLGLLKKVLTFLKEEKNIHADIKLWFGPAICNDCYQIDRATDTHFDLISQNTRQAHDVFQPSAISIQSDTNCTLCKNGSYHSYRAEGSNVKMNYFSIGLL